MSGSFSTSGESSISSYAQEKHQVVETAQRLVEKGYLMATGGNLSIRIPGQAPFAVTPSNYDYLIMAPDDVRVLDFNLNVLEGEPKPSLESALHASVYVTRADVNAVVHTHQVYASALALINAPIPALFDEQVRFLGRSVEIIPYPALRHPLSEERHRQAYSKSQQRLHPAEPRRAVLRPRCGARRAQRRDSGKVLAGFLFALCTERKTSRIPLPVREIAFAKLRKDQKKAECGEIRAFWKF